MMKLKIKTKLSLGLGFLFLVILLIGSAGALYIHAIANESKTILKDNYESIQYSEAMLEASDDLLTDSVKALARIETNLRKQEQNITETGEKNYTNNVRLAFDRLKTGKRTILETVCSKKIIVQGDGSEYAGDPTEK